MLPAAPVFVDPLPAGARTLDFDGLIGNFPDLTMTGLEQGAIYALVALGYTLVYGVLRLINFAHSEVFMIGTFAAMWTWGVYGLRPEHRGHRRRQASCCWSSSVWSPRALASAATAVAVELVAYRPLRRRNAPPLAFLITAIGASLRAGRGGRHLSPVAAPFGMPQRDHDRACSSRSAVPDHQRQLLVLVDRAAS